MMAISRAALLKELLPALNELFGTEYETEPGSWAVYADYLCEDMSWHIRKVEPWRRSVHEDKRGIYKITDQPDELGAYKAFMESRN